MMDHLAQVRRKSKQYEDAKAAFEQAMEDRNAAIRRARAERHGPGAIGTAANLTPEQVRRICKTKARQPTYGWTENGIQKKDE